MSKKSLIIVAAFLVTPVFFQLSSYSVRAETPMTTPSTFFNLVGKVTYKQLGKLMGNTQRITPASNITVKVNGFFDRSKKYEVKTDVDGNYMLQVPEGMYSIEVADHASDKTDFFVPPFTVEKVKENKTAHADFQGLLFR